MVEQKYKILFFAIIKALVLFIGFMWAIFSSKYFLHGQSGVEQSPLLFKLLLPMILVEYLILIIVSWKEALLFSKKSFQIVSLTSFLASLFIFINPILWPYGTFHPLEQDLFLSILSFLILLSAGYFAVILEKTFRKFKG